MNGSARTYLRYHIGAFGLHVATVKVVLRQACERRVDLHSSIPPFDDFKVGVASMIVSVVGVVGARRSGGHYVILGLVFCLQRSYECRPIVSREEGAKPGTIVICHVPRSLYSKVSSGCRFVYKSDIQVI